MKLRLSVVTFSLLLLAAMFATAAEPRLRVSDNAHYRTYANGKPFFYLADTAWELFHRLDREEADQYLEDRAHKGFTVIQSVALAEEHYLAFSPPYTLVTDIASDDICVVTPYRTAVWAESGNGAVNG